MAAHSQLGCRYPAWGRTLSLGESCGVSSPFWSWYPARQRRDSHSPGGLIYFTARKQRLYASPLETKSCRDLFNSIYTSFSRGSGEESLPRRLYIGKKLITLSNHHLWKAKQAHPWIAVFPWPRALEQKLYQNHSGHITNGAQCPETSLCPFVMHYLLLKSRC